MCHKQKFGVSQQRLVVWPKLSKVFLGKPPDKRKIRVKQKTNKLVQVWVETTKIIGNC